MKFSQSRIFISSFSTTHTQARYTFKDLTAEIGQKNGAFTLTGMNASGGVAGSPVNPMMLTMMYKQMQEI